MAKKLTTVQVYRVLKEYQMKNGFPPAIREIAPILGISVGTVYNHMVRLKKMGWLSGEPNKARSLKFHR